LGLSMEALRLQLSKVQSELFTGVSKGVFHKKTAARKFSRLTLRLNKKASDLSKSAS
jgi:ribosomal protein S20